MESENFWKSKSKKEQGQKGEEKCSEFLRSQGFDIFKRNWRTPFGEVDLVASQGKILFIFEVKTRRDWDERKRLLVSWSQKKRLSAAALWIWQKHRHEFENFKCRVLLVTRGGIHVLKLPLLYDST